MAGRASHVLVSVASLALGLSIGIFLTGGIPRGVVGAAAPATHAPTMGAPQSDASSGTPKLVAGPSAESRSSAIPAAASNELPEPPAAELGSPIGGLGGGPSAVAGSIATLEGTPVSGVELELEPPKDAPKYRARRATSDASGRFEFPDLPRGEWRITGRHRSYVLLRRNSFPPLVPTGANVEFVACPAVPVDVRVTGEGAERARVAFRRANGGEPQWSPWTSASTVLALSPGTWELCASVDALDDWPSDRNWKLAPLASPVVTVHVGGGGSEVPTLLLARTRCLWGTVRLPPGYQCEADESRPGVRLVETSAGTRADFEIQGDRLSRRALIDHEGRYGFFALPFEHWTAGASLDGWSAPGVVRVVDVAGMTRLDLEMDGEREGEGSVTVEAFTAGGDRITSGISFSFLHRDSRDRPDDYVWQGAHAVLEPGGAIRLLAVPLAKEVREKAAKKRELVLQATLSGFARIEQVIPGLTGERLRLSFDPGADLEIAIDGDGAERAMRKCNAELENDEYHDQAVFDEGTQSLRFASLGPGRYTLTVTVWGSDEDGEWRSMQLHKGELSVRAGSQRITLHMPARADLVVRCPDVKKDVRANLYGPLPDPMADRESSWWAPEINAKVDGSGQVTFVNIVAGRYRLTIGERMQIVTAPCPPVDFVGRIPERHRFRLRQGDSPLRRAGLRSGDVYVALDGEALTIEAAQTRLGALGSQKEGTLKLTVERDGRNLELAIDAAALGENESFEFDLEPVVE